MPLRSGQAIDRHAGGGQPARRLSCTSPAGRRPGAGDDRRARRGGGGEFPAGRAAALRRVPRPAHRAAEPAPDHRRARPSRSRCARPARWSRSCSSTWTGCATSTSRWATRPATSCSPRWPSGCAAIAGPGALVGRIGGDEFVVTLRAESTEATVQLATQMREQLRGPMVVGTLTLDVDTAVGVAVQPGPRRRPGGPAAAGRAGRQRGQGRPVRRPALPPGAGVPGGAPARPRRRPAPGAGRRRARGLLPAQGHHPATGTWSASSAWPAGSTRRTARWPRRTSSRSPSTPASCPGSPRWC